MAHQASPVPQPAPLLYRFLRLFTEIHPGEAVTAILLVLNTYLLLTCYYIIKPVRDGLINAGQGAEFKSYLSAATAVVLVFVVKGFSRLASRVPRQRLIATVLVFFILTLVLFYGLYLARVSLGTIGIVFFVYAGVFSVMLPAQFWGFANDIYTEAEGRRLFPLIAFGATFGALTGSAVARYLVGALGSYAMMLVAAGVLCACIALTLIVHRREVEKIRRKSRGSPAAGERPLAEGGGFKLLFSSRYLTLIALFILILNLVNTNGQYILDKVFSRAAQEAAAAGAMDGLSAADFMGRLYADFQLTFNIIAVVIQLFLVSRVFKAVGVRGALFVLPVLAFGGYAMVALGATLAAVRWTKAVENATDYSMMNTTRHALFLTTSREAKYKAKAAVDTFFHRAGDVLSALIVFLGTGLLALRVEGFAAFNLAVVVVWILVGVLIAREHAKVTARGAGAASGPGS
ncbi:MAG: translocase [Candidatus Aminicenantes bacterium]|nr:translocase [Candidatus Aminicenantes bacterium]